MTTPYQTITNKTYESGSILQFFEYGHLPEHLKVVSKPFGDLAQTIVDNLPHNSERSVALRKLLESKDAAVRAAIQK
jgi:hypothetical protein